MTTNPSSLLEVAKRLRAVMLDTRMEVKDLADLVGAERSAASNWVNGYNLPPVARMTKLAQEKNLTLDWIYRGVPDHLPMASGIRLTALLQQLSDEALSNAAAAPEVALGAKKAPRRKKAKAT